MSDILSSSPRELLAQCLQEGRVLIGEIVMSGDFSLRHREDIVLPEEELTRHESPEAAREIARYDEAGHYRPLKTAPTLRRGWFLKCKNFEEMYLALDFFYPAALSLYSSFLNDTLKPTSLRETLGRQTGMYRVTQKLKDEEAASLIQKICYEGCLRNILWSMCVDQKAQSLIVRENEIPLLCREACNLLVAEARNIVKESS